MKSIAQVFLVFVILFLINSCGDASVSSDSFSSEIYISNPDETTGLVSIIGTSNTVDGEGTVTAISLTASPSPLPKNLESGCERDTSSSYSDGSFAQLSVCADADDIIKITHIRLDSTTSIIGNFTVPSKSSDTCTEKGQRRLIVINESDEDIWLGVTAGSFACKTNADCPSAGTGCTGADPAKEQAGHCTCDKADENQCGTFGSCDVAGTKCVWKLPVLSQSQVYLPKVGTKTSQSTICIPAAPSGNTIQWSGNIFARTGCSGTGEHFGQQCETGECGNTEKNKINCPTGTGGAPPATLFEFTFSNQDTDRPKTAGADFYDASIINGINLGLEVGPISGTVTVPKTNKNPYFCKIAGNRQADGELKACDWIMDPIVMEVDRKTLLRDVSPTSFAASGSCPNDGKPNGLGYCECTKDSDCPSDLFCGNATNAFKPTKTEARTFNMVCGNHIGWWTADQICGATINNTGLFKPFGEPLNCDTMVDNIEKLVGNTIESTYTNFYICTQPTIAADIIAEANKEKKAIPPYQAQSCYNNAAVSDCCGCATSKDSPFKETWALAINPAFGGEDNGCYSHNEEWFEIAQPWIVFLKKACPTAYTYPFDDMTSTFTCQKIETAEFAPAYQLVFFNTE